jgi:hypothetical protein
MAFGNKQAAFLAAATPPVERDPAPDYAAVAKLAELLSAPAAVKARLAELKAAVELARKETVDAGRERAAVAKLRADVEADLAKQRAQHDDKLAAELVAHELAMRAGRDALLAETKVLADARKVFEQEKAALKTKADTLRASLGAA